MTVDGEKRPSLPGRGMGKNSQYLPFLRTYGEMPEREFIALPIATADDVQARANRQSAA